MRGIVGLLGEKGCGIVSEDLEMDLKRYKR